MTPRVLVGLSTRVVGFQRPWLDLMRLEMPEGSRFRYVEGSQLHHARNAIADEALRRDFSHVLYLDDDHFFPPFALNRLLSHGVPVVSALVPLRVPPYEPAAFLREKDGRYSRVPTTAIAEAHGNLLRVGAVTSAFTLFETKVFATVPRPWYEWGRWYRDGTQQSEDICFSEKVARAGFPQVVDCGLSVGHLTTLAVVLDAEGKPQFVSPEQVWQVPV